MPAVRLRPIQKDMKSKTSRGLDGSDLDVGSANNLLSANLTSANYLLCVWKEVGLCIYIK